MDQQSHVLTPSLVDQKLHASLPGLRDQHTNNANQTDPTKGDLVLSKAEYSPKKFNVVVMVEYSKPIGIFCSCIFKTSGILRVQHDRVKTAQDRAKMVMASTRCELNTR